MKPPSLMMGVGLIMGSVLLGESVVILPMLWNRAETAERQLTTARTDVQRSRRRIEDLTVQLKNQTDQISQLQSKVESHEADLATARDTASFLTQQVTDLQAKNRALSADAARVTMLETQIANFQKQSQSGESTAAESAPASPLATDIADRKDAPAAEAPPADQNDSAPTDDLVAVEPGPESRPIVYDKTGWRTVSPIVTGRPVIDAPPVIIYDGYPSEF